MKIKKLLLTVLCAVMSVGAWAQTDVTSTYLVNPSFELKAEGTASTAAALSKTGGTYYGWTLPVLANDYSNVSIGSSSACDGNGFGISSASEGSFYFFNRRGWSNTAAEISQTASLPAGKYFITVDYKAYEKGGTTGTLGIKVGDTQLITTKPYYSTGNSTSGSWANTDPWKTVGAWFTVETEGNVKIAITEQLNGTSARADLYLDNVRLYKWDLEDNINYANASKTSPLDVTAKFVQNPYFDDNINSWTSTTGASNNQRATNKGGAHSGGFWENWNNGAKTSGKMSQTVTGLPSGLYKVTASAHASEGTSANVSLFANSNKTAITWQDASAFYSVESSKVTDGKLEFGIEIGAGNACNWLGLDNVRLEYIQPAVGVMAAELPVEASIAGKWYKYSVPTAGGYRITSSAAATVMYTQDGSLLDDEVTTSLTFTAGQTRIEELAAGTIYLKADVASTIAIVPNTFTYEVGSATTDMTYVQPGKVVTISYADAVTNDDEATFGINGTPEVTFNGTPVEVTATEKGFTFTVPEDLEVASTYTLNIPANAFGYEVGSTYNEAQNIEFKTPEIFDQIAYIYSPLRNKFLSRGKDSGTSAVLDEYGIPVNIKTNGVGKTTVLFVDNQLYLYGPNWAWTDASEANATYYTVEPFTSTTSSYVGYKFISNLGGNVDQNLYINYGTLDRLANNSADGSNLHNDDYMVFQIKTKAERDAMKSANDLAAIIAVATAAGETVASLADFENLLATKTAVDQTSKVQSASLKNGINGWTATNTRKSSSEYTTDENVVEFYQSAEKITQTVSGLEQGIYKVTLNGLFRAGSAANCVTYEDYDLSNAYIKANNYQVNLKSWASDRSNDTTPGRKSEAATAFSNGSYLNTLYTYVGEDGKLTLTIDNPNYQSVGWVVFNNLTLTYYAEESQVATAEDITALTEAINAKTLGFAQGEYAPYTNIEAAKAYKAAKAIDTEKPCLQSDVQVATTALTSATWTPNTEEMNAFYPLSNYTTTSAKDGENRVYALGWDKNGGTDAYNTRIMVAPDPSNAGLTSNALFTKFNTNYGKVEGYTMPFKANQLYKVTFDYAGWGNNPTTKIVVKDANGTAVTLSNANFRPAINDGNANAEHWYSFEAYFVTNEAGNYVIELNKVDGGQQQTVLSNMELKTSNGALARTTTTGKYGTICLPYAATVEGATVYSAAVNGTTVELTEVGTDLVAGTPYIYQATADAQTFSYTSGNVVAAPVAAAPLVGVFTETVVPKGSYVMQTQNNRQAFYYADVDNYKTDAYKCYLTVPAEPSSARLDIVIEGETGINDLGTENDSIADGKYMQNNKVVIVKNGRKYNVTGQLVK